MTPSQLLRGIIRDLRVELAEEFDRNFERKGFFSDKWKPRACHNPRGTLLMVTGTLRRSIRAAETAGGVRFTSSVPYAQAHNEGSEGTRGVRAHTRRSRKGKSHAVRAHNRRTSLPQRRFVGDGRRTREIIQSVISAGIERFNRDLQQSIKD